MKLLELVKYFRSGGSFKDFCNEERIDLDSEVVEIYMEEPLDLNGNLGFFEIEKTEGAYEFFNNNIKYINLFDFYYFLDAIEDSNNDVNKELSDRKITEILYEYAINDA
ncbi:hypothetical protein [uncultured Chryseobacterium sp.]|uniref:hypothetical protein n=2 Tax=uncultured Chryseobacterium sp. TaxID=259322 RepID=UPI0025E321EB|nr:hypothetical protein [uncultured Chryseobacterium sp.]